MKSITIKTEDGTKLIRVWLDKKDRVWAEALDTTLPLNVFVTRKDGSKVVICLRK